MWNLVLCILCIAYPLAAAHHATTLDALERWRAYLVCFGVFVLPLVAWPWWFPLRTELIFALSLVFGSHDARGAHAIYLRYVVPALRPWKDVHVCTMDDLLEHLESWMRPRAPPPLVTRPSPVMVEDESDDQAEEGE